MKRLYFASLHDCNENCLFCVRRGKETPIAFINTLKAKEILFKKRKQGYQEVYFDGGEPTLRNDLVELISFAKSKGFEAVNVLTNAVLLSDKKLTEKILSIKNNRNFTLSFSVSLHSHKKNVSEKLVGQKNTFNKTIKGIKNLIKSGSKNISIYHIITKYNYRDLSLFVSFINKEFPLVKDITFSFIYPAGAALENQGIFPQLSKVEPYFQKSLNRVKKFNFNFSISTCGTIPLCFLKGYENILLKQQELDQPENVGIIDAGQDVKYQLATKEFHKKTKIKSNLCGECLYNEQCGGIWRTYVEKYGLEEFRPIQRRVDQGNVLLVVTGWSCNNNCVFCSTVADRNINRNTSEIFSDLKKGFKDGYRIVEFIGGEVSIRSDFFLLISQARKIGFKDIRLTTNGRCFSYPDFAKKAVKSGLKVINFSLYGDTRISHDGVTRTPGSFEQCLKGIKNILVWPEVKIVVNTVITKANYKRIGKMADFLKKIGLREWRLLELLPDGRAIKMYHQIAAGYQELSFYLNKVLKFSDNFDKIDIFDFPFCLFEPKVFELENILFFTPKHRCEDISQIGFKPERVVRKKIGQKIIYQDKYKIKPGVCLKCKYFSECGGLAKPYFKKYGDKEIKLLARRHHLLNG